MPQIRQPQPQIGGGGSGIPTAQPRALDPQLGGGELPPEILELLIQILGGGGQGGTLGPQGGGPGGGVPPGGSL